MPLASIQYLFFLLISAVVFYSMPARIRWVWLLIVSLTFCAIVSPESLPILLVLVLATFGFGLALETPSRTRKRIALYGGLAFLIGVLLAFKYSQLYGRLELRLSVLTGRHPDAFFAGALLPLGLSFFIFTALSYLFDVFHNRVPAERNIGRFALHLLFFTKLGQGPIERPGRFLPQLRASMSFDESAIGEGLKRILWGFFKKMVIADRIALYVNAVYGNADRHNGTSLLLAALFYSFQIYTDFSAYTDIALGSAQVFGLRLSENFRRPYFARTIHDFWGRWHISFSTWLRDYLYLPLAYFLSGRLRKERYVKLPTEQLIFAFTTIVTFFVCGLWHGKGLNYIVWGLVFGVYIVIGRWTRRPRGRLRARLGLAKSRVLGPAIRILATFGMVTASWVFFRLPDLRTAVLVFRKIVAQPGIPFGYASPPMVLFPLLGIAFLLSVEAKEEFYHGPRSLFQNRRLSVRLASYALLVMIILSMGILDGGQFIYFQF
jgi:alginate O-acetyltransferase complex protein AlgI